MMGMHGKSLGVLVIAAGCALDPKTVGMGTDTDVDDGSGSASEASDTDEPSESNTMPSVSAGSEGSDTSCEGANCAWDPCSELACGAFCDICDPNDPECALPGTFTVCTDQGTCEIWPNWDESPCPGQGLEPGFETQLTETGGCGDIVAYIANEDATQALHVRVQDLVDMAQAAGEPITVEYAGDDPAVELEVTVGSDLLVLTCTDVGSEPPPIEERWFATTPEGGDAGTITFEVTYNGEQDADVTITIDGVTLQRDADVFDVPIVIEHLVLADVHVGWLPG
jgi:hypothetical protein